MRRIIRKLEGLHIFLRKLYEAIKKFKRENPNEDLRNAEVFVECYHYII